MITGYKKESKGSIKARIAACYHIGNVKGIKHGATLFAFIIFQLLSGTQANAQVSAMTATATSGGGGTPTPPGAVSGTAIVNLPLASSPYSVPPIVAGTTLSWSISPGNAGTISSNLNNATVTWNQSYTGTANISVVAVNSSGARSTPSNYTVTIISPVSPASQNINYSTNASTLTCGSSTGVGLVTATPSYQWQSSPTGDGSGGGSNTSLAKTKVKVSAAASSTWTDVSGATNPLNFTPTNLTGTTYFHLKVTTNGISYTSAQALVTVYPQVVSGILSPATQAINYNTTAASIISGAPSGGIGSYAYQWQSSPDNASWVNINGATTSSYSPGNLTTTSYYHLLTSSNNSTPVISNSALVTVYPQVVSGTLSPATQAINYNTTAAAIISGAPTGGNGSYAYQWQSSPDNANWVNINGATASGYSPGNLTATTYYHLLTSSNNNTPVISNSASVTVYPQLVPGTISSSPQTINYNAVPSPITCSAPTGGNGTYQYQWTSSPTGVQGSFNNVPSSAIGYNQLTYYLGAMTASTYYQLQVTSNGVTLPSNTVYITVTPAPPNISYPVASSLLSFVVNKPISTISPNNTGGVITSCSATPTLPTGLNLDSKTGIISGTPTASKPTTVYTITGYNAGGSSATTLTVGVNPGLPINLSRSQNYVATYQPRVKGIVDNPTLTSVINDRTQVQTTVQYIDGLGRPIQTVQFQASPSGNDIVLPQAYDQFGREATKYLPYALLSTATSDGSYKADALSTSTTATGAQLAFYTTNTPIGVTHITTPQAVSVFEPSPLDRVAEQGAPGDTWQPTGTTVTTPNTTPGHTIKMIYATNDGTAYWANWYNVTIDTNGNRKLVYNGKYPANQLNVTVVVNENWNSSQNVPNTVNDPRLNTTEEYKDIEGHVVLKRTYNYNTVTASVETLSTYYVDDDFGNLAFVLPPLAGGDGSIAIAQATLNNLCYQYNYDERNRLIKKNIPGKGWEYLVYNGIDQVVATQDSVQRLKNQWLVTKYDGQGRVIVTGLWNAGQLYSIATLQANMNNYPLWDTRDYTNNKTQNPTGYLITSYPQINQVLTINYYDDYTFTGQPTAFNTGPTNYNTSPRGLQTASLTAVLNTIGNKTPDMLWAVHYYDGLGRNILTYAQHYLGGTINVNNYDAISTTYDFSNAPTTVTRQHYTVNGTSSSPLLAATIFNKYIYDQVGRKLRSWENINNGNPILVSQMVYNEVGQVLNKQLHSTDSINFAQTISYTYNERGWLLGSSAPLFAMQLQYNANPAGLAGFATQYNGNIASQLWGTPGSLGNNYRYTYDNLNRLTGGTSNGNNNETGISYDLMGNIKTLNRTQANILIDQLSYTYASGTNNTNQLQSIKDVATDNSTIPTGTTSYTYDANGNMLTNKNTAITTKNKTFTYNLLNLPQKVTVPTGTSTFTYDATGNKLRKVAVLGSTTVTTDYVNGIQYKNGAIDFIQTDEGKIAYINNAYDYEYYLGDNLGNTRVMFNVQGGVATALQKDDYLPFGFEIPNGSPANPKNEYLYNKKELQEELTEYDYGARFYDPLIARWNTVDPDAENYESTSSYAYVLNNPINLGDVDGRDTIHLKEVFIHATKPAPKPQEPIEIKPIERKFSPFVVPRPPAFTIPILTLVFVLLPANYDDHEEADNLKLMATRKDPKHPGSYTIKFKNGKRYHGKGSFSRALQSAKQIAKDHETSFEISDIDWTPSTSNEQSFRDEAKRLEADGGKNNPNNYNQIDSPGSHKYKQDK